jgi:hypothetical protein
MSTPTPSDRRGRPLALLLLLASLALARVARADDDPLAPYRERFRAGMERYKSGSVSEAIQYWEPIYREIGPAKGYRLSFDLARAYDAIGESTRAAERYESFLDELTSRRSAGDKLDPVLGREEEEARSRLGDLQITKGRIGVKPGGRPILAQIDLAEPRLGSFVAYVAPGTHVVTFGAGSADAEKHEIVVKAGELVEVAPNPAPPPPPPSPPPAPAASSKPETPAAPPPVAATGTVHPFSPAFVYVAGGAAAVSVVVPIVTYSYAWSIVQSYRTAPDTSSKNSAVSQYAGAKTTAYATLAIPIGLAAVTAGLAAWYFVATRQRDTTSVHVGVAPIPGGASAGVSARF